MLLGAGIFVFISIIPDYSAWLLYHSFAMLKFCLDFGHTLQNVLVTISALISSDLIDMKHAMISAPSRFSL